jgi:hypothetical protein
LKNSWADTFYQEFFYRIEEKPFAVLYPEKASRPNVPVNVLVGLEALKPGWDGAIRNYKSTFAMTCKCGMPWVMIDWGMVILRFAPCTIFESS